ncbi:MAG: M48 family metallopeptidase [Cellvibrionaceae bacterium]
MEYRNPKIPEGINVSNEHPLKNFFFLLAGVSIAIVTIVLLLSFSVGYLVKFVPFETEQKLTSKFETQFEQFILEAEKEESQSVRHQQVTTYLQTLADDLSKAQNLPEDIKITVHYLDEPVVNAFATLGGHIVIYQGLIDALNSENALSMVVAHEIAHVKYRHPIVAMGRGLSIGLILSTITGFGESAFASDMVGQMGLFTALAFSRSQETESDLEAYQTLVNHYGHAQGATDLFFELKKIEGSLTPPELLSSHPLSEKRILKLEKLGENEQENCSQKEGECVLTPLPEFLLKEK